MTDNSSFFSNNYKAEKGEWMPICSGRYANRCRANIRSKFLVALTFLFCTTISAVARTTIFDPTVKTLQAMVDNNWRSPLVMTLGGNNVMTIGFDQLSHDYHRYVYRVEHCEYDWTPSTEIFESDFLEGFNDNPIDDYQKSINTNILYTHYSMKIPNERCRLKMSGNYKLYITDEDSGEKVAEVEFMVVDQQINVSMSTTTNTDIDINEKHQQVGIKLDFSNLSISNPSEQLRLVVRQNDCEESERRGIKPNLVSHNQLEWLHNKQLIFLAGNEYRKFEVLDVSHPTMGIERIVWDGHDYQVFPFEDAPRKNYLTDVSANGYALVRNSDNSEIDYTCEYVYVHYCLMTKTPLNGDVYVDGHWATDANRQTYAMEYDPKAGCYRATILQKQGYYSYRYLLVTPDGIELSPTEGNFYETENEYQAYVYYRGTGDRTWKLVSANTIAP